MPAKYDWNINERTETLKKLWPTHSARQIAKELGGVTRNAVIGKAHRLKLKAKTPGYNAPHGANTKRRKQT